VDGNNLIGYPGGPKGFMVALNKKTGEQVWANTDIKQRPSNASPVLVEDKGIRQIITMTSFAVIGVDADTGKLLWNHSHVNRFKENVELPIYDNGDVYVSSGYWKGTEKLKLTYEGKAVKVTRVWVNKKADNLHGGLILLDGHIFGNAYEKPNWFCLDAKTGQATYMQPGIGKGKSKASIIYADGLLYCFGSKGEVALLKPDPKAFTIVSQFKIPKGDRTNCYAHPAILNGRLYLRRGNHLYAYDVRAK